MLLVGFRCNVGLLNIIVETDPSRLKLDQQINTKLKREKHMGARHGHSYFKLYIACVDAVLTDYEPLSL